MVRMPVRPSLEEARDRVEDVGGDEVPFIDAGPLAGKLSSSVKLVAAGVIMAVVAVANFVLALNSDSDFPDLAKFAWIVGWITLMLGIACFWIAGYVRVEKERRLEEEMFKTEPRVYGLDYSTPRIVMVRCKYCGTLNAENASKCMSCGATL